MTDVDIIKKFMSKNGFVSKGDPDYGGSDHVSYFPPAGVELNVVLRGEGSKTPYAQVKFSGHVTYDPSEALEHAAFVVDGDSLVAHFVVLRPGVLLTEKLTMLDDDTMEHQLTFHDNKETGRWICIPKT